MRVKYDKIRKFTVSAIDYVCECEDALKKTKNNLEDGAVIDGKVLCIDELSDCAEMLNKLLNELHSLQVLCNTKILEIDRNEAASKETEGESVAEEDAGNNDKPGLIEDGNKDITAVNILD